MTSATKAGFYNIGLATAAAGAAAFATFAMPDQLLQEQLEGWGLILPVDDTVRFGATAIVGLFAFILSFVSLKACDRRGPGRRIVVAEEPQELLLPIENAEPALQPAVRTERNEDPFLELARGVEPAQAPVDVASTVEVLAKRRARSKPAPIPAPKDAAEVAGMSTKEFLARIAAGPKGEETFQGMMQRLNAGLADHEWPIQPETQEEDAEVRLRDVLQNLKSRARNG